MMDEKVAATLMQLAEQQELMAEQAGRVLTIVKVLSDRVNELEHQVAELQAEAADLHGQTVGLRPLG